MPIGARRDRFLGFPRQTIAAKEFYARTDPLPVSELASGGAGSLLRSPNPQPASPEWFNVGQFSMIARNGALADVDDFALGTNEIPCRLSGDITTLAVGTNEVVCRKSGDITTEALPASSFLGRLGTGDITDINYAGSSFPGSPSAGQPFWHTTHAQGFIYTGSGWISMDTYTVHGGETAAESSYLALLPFNTQYQATGVGWNFPFDVKCVWISAWMDSSATATIAVRDDGTDVLTLAYVSAAGRKSTTGLSSTIVKDSCISLAITSGISSTNCLVMAGFRRFET